MEDPHSHPIDSHSPLISDAPLNRRQQLTVGLLSERQRIRCELQQWRLGHPGFQHMLGGWKGAGFTMLVLALSGFVDPERLNTVFRLAVTPYHCEP